MNVHERVRKTLDHEEPDRVPTMEQYIERPFIKKIYSILPLKEKIRQHFKVYQNIEMARLIGFDSAWLHYGKYNVPYTNKPEIPKDIKAKYNLDNCNVWAQCSRNGWYYDGALKTKEQIEEWTSFLKSWEPAHDYHFKHFKKIWDWNIKHDFLPIPTGGCVSYATWSSIGINRFAYIYKNYKSTLKDYVKALGKITMDFQMMMFEHGVDMAFVCDDWAQKERLIFHPEQWREIIGPVYGEIAKNAHKHDAKFLVHTDGNITDCVPWIVEAQADAIEPLEYESGMRLKPLKEKYGDKITLIGNVPATFILTFGTKEETIEKTKECIKDAAKGGGYICAAGSDILGTCKLENVKTMIETVKKYGKYPIEL